MESMVERVARAHYEATHDMRVDLAWKDCHPSYREQEMRAMRTALQAMREPTEAMVRWGEAVETEGSAGYRAMIDAALNPPTPEG